MKMRVHDDRHKRQHTNATTSRIPINGFDSFATFATVSFSTSFATENNDAAHRATTKIGTYLVYFMYFVYYRRVLRIPFIFVNDGGRGPWRAPRRVRGAP